MTHIEDIFDFDKLSKHLREGMVRQQHHPDYPLTILNYTEQCQFTRAWDDVTVECRGLIYDTETHEVVARPFRKFFNYGDFDAYQPSPNESMWVYEKLDGSLIICAPWRGEVVVSSRGSFTSTQALWAQKLLGDVEPIEEYTLVFELIHPQNRIVVDYQGRQECVLLGARHIPTGSVIRPDELRLPHSTPRRCNASSLDRLQSAIPDSEEGYVCWFESGGMLKIKGKMYKQLHKLVFGINQKTVWEALSEGRYQEMVETLKETPNHILEWVTSYAAALTTRHEDLLQTGQQVADEASKISDERKYQAQHILQHPRAISSIAFAFLDKNPNLAGQIAWRHLKPSGNTQ